MRKDAMMTSLDIARQGHSAARQMIAQRNAGVLTTREFDRLMEKVLAGFEQMMPAPVTPPPPPVIPPGVVRASTLVVHDGGRA